MAVSVPGWWCMNIICWNSLFEGEVDEVGGHSVVFWKSDNFLHIVKVSRGSGELGLMSSIFQ